MNSTIPVGTPNGLVTPLSVSIPAGQAVTFINVLFNIQHSFTEDLIINLKAPNGEVINLVNRQGTDTSNDVDFINTVISPRATVRLSAGASPYTGTFLPDAVVGIGPTAAVSTANNFYALYSQPSGQWFLGIRDVSSDSGIFTNSGILKNWSITVNYGIAPAPDRPRHR